MALVVRCPDCRGVSQVDPSARGLTVQCPLCNSEFTAVPEAELITTSGTESRTTSTAPSRSREESRSSRTREETRPPRAREDSRSPRRRDEFRTRDESRTREKTERAKSREPNEDDHDPHRHPVSGLPASVLVGLALLPFAIPVLWVTAPPIIGHTPQLSFAVPLAIAVSASILSLAVIYTI